MIQYGKKKTPTAVAGHQNCAICHSEQKSLTARARREARFAIDHEYKEAVMDQTTTKQAVVVGKVNLPARREVKPQQKQERRGPKPERKQRRQPEVDPRVTNMQMLQELQYLKKKIASDRVYLERYGELRVAALKVAELFGQPNVLVETPDGFGVKPNPDLVEAIEALRAVLA